MVWLENPLMTRSLLYYRWHCSTGHHFWMDHTPQCHRTTTHRCSAEHTRNTVQVRMRISGKRKNVHVLYWHFQPLPSRPFPSAGGRGVRMCAQSCCQPCEIGNNNFPTRTPLLWRPQETPLRAPLWRKSYKTFVGHQASRNIPQVIIIVYEKYQWSVLPLSSARLKFCIQIQKKSFANSVFYFNSFLRLDFSGARS